MKSNTRAPRIKGICADAETLGVSRWHLFCVLTGRRQSPTLEAAYEALQRTKPQTANRKGDQP